MDDGDDSVGSLHSGLIFCGVRGAIPTENGGKSMRKETTCLGPGPCGKPTAEVALPVWRVIRGLGSGPGSAVGWAQMGEGRLPTGGRPAPLAIAPHEAHWASGPLLKEDSPSSAS